MDPAYLNPGQLLVDDGPKIKLQADRLQNFKPGAVFNLFSSSSSSTSSTASSMSDAGTSESSTPQTGLKNGQFYLEGPVSSVDFHGSGATFLATTLHSASTSQNPTKSPRDLHQLLYASSSSQLNPKETDSKVHLFNATKGIHTRTCTFSQHHIDIAKFTHHYSAVIHAGLKHDQDSDKSHISLGYTSLLDATQLNAFKGHTDRILSLSLNPIHDHFLSTSLDNTARLFDLRSDKTQGMLKTPSGALGCYDPQGLVFALALKHNCIKLFDARVLERGAFSSIWLSNIPPVTFTSIQFSPDGSMIIVSCVPDLSDEKSASVAGTFTQLNHIILIDAFNGQILQRISSPRDVLPLDKNTLKGVYADPEMIEFAPDKIDDVNQPPSHFSHFLAATHQTDSALTDSTTMSTTTPQPAPIQPSAQNPSAAQNARGPQYHNQILHPLPLDQSRSTTINSKYPNLPPPNYALPCSMTTDCKFLTFGTHIGTLPTHDIRNGRQVVTFSHKHQSELLHVLWNPTRTQLVTVDPYELCFWVPSAK